MCTRDLHNAHPSHESFSHIFKFPLENHSKMCWKSIPKILPTFLATWTGFWWHMGIQNSSQNHLKITKNHLSNPKNVTLSLPKPPRRLRSIRWCHRMPPKASKMAPRSLKTVKFIRQFTVVHSLQWTQISHARKSPCQFAVHRLWSVPDCWRLTTRCSRLSVSSLP